MELRNLGQSGLQVSLVGLGCNNFGGRLDLDATQVVVHKALDVGITLFDTADMYGDRGGSEEQLGKILGDRRKDIVLATKFGMRMDDEGVKMGASRRYIMAAVEDSLKRLQTDWIDLYQLHMPDPLTPIEETLRALEDLVTQGMVRYIGCSNLVAWQVVEAHWTAELDRIGRFIACQDEYNLLNRSIESDLFPVMEKYGLGLLPYFPLASGLLTSKYKRNVMPEGARLTENPTFANRVYVTEKNWSIVENLEKFAANRGHNLLELAFCWLAAQAPTVSIIAGATRPEQIEANVAAIGWELSTEEIAEINQITTK